MARSGIPARARRAKGLVRSVADTRRPVSRPRPTVKSAPTPRMNSAKASPRVGRIPGGGGSGVPKATTPMARPPKAVSLAKSGPVRRSQRLAKPRADFPPKI